jgi:hypothetical protein
MTTYNTLGRSGHRAAHWSLKSRVRFFGQSAVISSSHHPPVATAFAN